MAQQLEKVPLTPLRDNPQQDAIWKRWLATLARTVENVSHNLLTGLQGGTTSEYYHVTEDQHTEIVEGVVKAFVSAGETRTIAAGYSIVVADSFSNDGTLVNNGAMAVVK